MARNRNAARNTQPAHTASAAPRADGGSPGRRLHDPAGGSAWRGPGLSGRLARAALVAFGLVAGVAAQAALTASENPSADGSYRVSWTAVTGATKYQLLEDGAKVYEGTARSKSFTGKTAGSYAYTLTYCRYFPSPIGRTVCNLPSNFTALTVTVSSAPATPTPPAAPTLTVPATDADGGYKVSWTSPAGATTYRLEEKTNSGSWGSAYSGAKTSKTFSGKGTAVYAYRAKACAGAGNCSRWSATKSVRVDAGGLGAERQSQPGAVRKLHGTLDRLEPWGRTPSRKASTALPRPRSTRARAGRSPSPAGRPLTTPTA